MSKQDQSGKTPVTKDDLARIQQAEAKKGNTQTPKDGHVARIQSAADKHENKKN